ncbi:dynein light chain LC6, flagellar outer arm-like isoform X1 [Branchiostoma lanceolatum]|uniref:dynein light chain LC6, flagellar outer arm-like isoform X1 n=1 Tax=Branchiostoma lanceolatum TaxID=7740 RepID=UPI001132AE4C
MPTVPAHETPVTPHGKSSFFPSPIEWPTALFNPFKSDPKEVKEDVKQCEMPDDMKQHAIDTAKPLVAKKKPHKEVASTLKKEFDEKYEPTWICIVGTDYGSSITHAKECFIYMYLNKTAIMLFKA